jgi:hypothetical protein
VGSFETTAGEFRIPTVFDIAKVYKRLIVAVAQASGASPIDALISIYNSRISDKISDYRSSMYYESPEYLYLSYLEGSPLRD